MIHTNDQRVRANSNGRTSRGRSTAGTLVVWTVSAASGSCSLSMIFRARVRRCLRCGVRLFLYPSRLGRSAGLLARPGFAGSFRFAAFFAQGDKMRFQRLLAVRALHFEALISFLRCSMPPRSRRSAAQMIMRFLMNRLTMVSFIASSPMYRIEWK